MIIMMVFNTLTSYSHQKIISLFKRLINDEIDPRARFYMWRVTSQGLICSKAFNANVIVSIFYYLPTNNLLNN
jgi:hypothetical protein